MASCVRGSSTYVEDEPLKRNTVEDLCEDDEHHDFIFNISTSSTNPTESLVELLNIFNLSSLNTYVFLLKKFTVSAIK